jgi:hypothetical protein
VREGRTAFAILIALQAAHSIEEYIGRLWESFPPAEFVTGLISADHRRGFIVLNIALVAFGIWCAAWPVRRRWRSARIFVGFWIVIELINGVGHPLWSVMQRSYTPGVLTAPFLLATTLVLLMRFPSFARA